MTLSISIGFITSYVPFVNDRVKSFADFENSSNKGHYFIIIDTMQMIRDKPLYGVDLGNFQTIYNEYYISKDTKTVESFVSHAHNTTMQIWAETGLIGVVVFLFMFGSFLYYSLKNWLQNKHVEDLMFFMITLGTVLQGITDYSFGLNIVMKVYFFIVAVYLNYRYCIKRGKNEF